MPRAIAAPFSPASRATWSPCSCSASCALPKATPTRPSPSAGRPSQPPQDALASYDRALIARADYADALYNRGNALQDLKRAEEALASYDKALALNPRSATALYNRGNVLHQMERLAEALADYDQALK